MKLDTNGSNPNVIEELLNENLLDYLAMDIKTTYDKYSVVIGSKLNKTNIVKSINIIKKSNCDHEFRTTIIKDYHDEETIRKICKIIDGDKYFLQMFQESENVLNKKLSPYSEKELIEIYKKIKKDFSNVNIRGIKNELYKEEELKCIK